MCGCVRWCCGCSVGWVMMNLFLILMLIWWIMLVLLMCFGMSLCRGVFVVSVC